MEPYQYLQYTFIHLSQEDESKYAPLGSSARIHGGETSPSPCQELQIYHLACLGSLAIKMHCNYQYCKLIGCSIDHTKNTEPRKKNTLQCGCLDTQDMCGMDIFVVCFRPEHFIMVSRCHRGVTLNINRSFSQYRPPHIYTTACSHISTCLMMK